MTVFLIIAALLTAGAVMFVLPALIGKGNGDNQQVLRNEINLSVLRDQMRELDADLAAGAINFAGHVSAKLELERRVAEDVQIKVASKEVISGKPWTALSVGLTIPAIALSLYFYLGNPDAFKPAEMADTQDPANADTFQQISAMVSGLEKKLKEKPNDPKGWYMLARSFYTLKKYQQSADTYAKLVSIVPDNADLLADYADTLAMAQNRNLQGEPEKLIGKALVADPNNVKALSLSGSAAFDRRDFQTAVTQWKKILLLVPPGSDSARTVLSNIGEAQGLAGDSSPFSLPLPAPTQSAPVEPIASSAAGKGETSVTGTVEIDAALRSRMADTDTVFIFARAADGPKFPLAVIRKQVKDLPMSFVLDDSMSMMPSTKLSNFPMLIVGARISKSGNATPGVGDFEGVMAVVKPGATGLKLLVNSERK